MDANKNGLARRVILGTFCFLANAYLVGFALDAVLSTIDDATWIVNGAGASPLIRNIVAELVVIGAPLALLLCLFVPHLPKRVLVPPALFALWCAIGAPGTAGLYDTAAQGSWLRIVFPLAQLALAVLTFRTLKAKTGAWFLASKNLPPKDHLVLRTLGATAIAIVAVPVFLALWLVAGATNYLEQKTDGFLKFTWSGIETHERVLTKDGKSVHLIGMMHLAEPQFYEHVFGEIPPKALVLAEGVSDRQHRLSGRLSYEGAAQALGLVQQPGLASKSAPAATDKAPPSSETAKPSTEVSDTGAVIERADVDVSDFSPITLKFLDDVVTIYGSKSLGEAFKRVADIGSRYTQPDVDAVFKDILDKRNATVIAAFDRKAGTADPVYIPWGALHMPGIEAALVERGYKVTSSRAIPLVHYFGAGKKAGGESAPEAPHS